MIDEYRGELVADGLVHERRRDRRVDAAGECGDDAGGSDLFADAGDLLFDDVVAVPVSSESCGLMQEVLDDLLAVVGVLDLWMPLHAVEALLVAAEGRDRGVGGGCENGEASGALATWSP